jgi:hypothetical protein
MKPPTMAKVEASLPLLAKEGYLSYNKLMK